MCYPGGPRYGNPGRTAFITIEECRAFPLEAALEKYPDNEEAMDLLKEYIRRYIEHTDRWMINELYHTDRCLARIAAIPENYKYFTRCYRILKRMYKAG